MRAFVVASMLAITAPALADPPEPATDLVTRPLVLGAGQLEARLTVEVNLQKGVYGTPLSFAPDLWYGLTDRWTLGVTHSNASLDRIEASASLCVRELQDVCDRLYRGGAIEARWSARSGAFAVAPRGRLLLREVDPVKPALLVGALLRWTRGRFMVASDPYVRFGLANTDLGNRTAISVPLYLGVQPTCHWLVALHTGWDTDLAVFHDGWHMPFGLLVRARATSQIEVSVEAGFGSLIGVQNNIKQRAVMLSVSWRSR